MIDSMLSNLISNAVGFSERSNPIDVEATGEANELTLPMRDRGQGIAASGQ